MRHRASTDRPAFAPTRITSRPADPSGGDPRSPMAQREAKLRAWIDRMYPNGMPRCPKGCACTGSFVGP